MIKRRPFGRRFAATGMEDVGRKDQEAALDGSLAK
jgi:hypothetical protein